MQKESSIINPLRALSIPFAFRAALGLGLALYITFDRARDLAQGFANDSYRALTLAIFLAMLALFDIIFSFRALVPLNQASLDSTPLSGAYDEHEMLGLMNSLSMPNEKFISPLGGWLSRLSSTFRNLPVPYQQLVEIAFSALVLGVLAIAMFVFSSAFGHASGSAESTAALDSWLVFGVVVYANGFWALMARKAFAVLRAAGKINGHKIVMGFVFIIVVSVLVSVMSQRVGWRLADAPAFPQWSRVTLIGSVVTIVAILILARMRARDYAESLDVSRIDSHNVATFHPNTLVPAINKILRSRAGRFTPLYKQHVDLTPSGNIGGTFNGNVISEYGIKLERFGADEKTRRFGFLMGLLAAGAGVMCELSALDMLNAPRLETMLLIETWFVFSGVWLTIAIVALHETVWESYLVGAEVKGSFTQKIFSGGAQTGLGGYLVDYSVNGAVCRVESVAFITPFQARFKAERVMLHAGAADDDARSIIRNVEHRVKEAASA
jgi:hypothetical protein